MNLFSIKMRGAYPIDHKLGGIHISGGECITSEEMIKETVLNLIDRALKHNKGKSDFINVSIQKIHKPNEIKYIHPLPITTLNKNINNLYPNMILKKLGFKDYVIPEILDTLFNLKNLRGAIITSANDFKNFEYQVARCTNMDYHADIKHSLNSFLEENNFSNKLKDALCISSKVCENENVLCEICISDDEDYFTGYISSKKLGYVRIENFKPKGHKHGGRIIFLKDASKINSTIDYLKNSIVIIKSIPKLNEDLWWLNV